MMQKDNINNDIENILKAMSTGLRSVTVLTYKGSKNYINCYYTKFDDEQSKQENAIHEIVANSFHALRAVDNDPQMSFLDESSIFNWTDDIVPNFDIDPNALNISDQYVNKYFDEIQSQENRHVHFKDMYDVVTGKDLAQKYTSYFSQLKALESYIKYIVEVGDIDGYVLIGNFNDKLGYFATDLKEKHAELNYQIQNWINHMSVKYDFNIQNYISKMINVKRDPIINVTKSINSQLSIPFSEDTIKTKNGVLLKVPRFGRKYLPNDSTEVNDDVEFQRIADEIKLINPMSYFMYISTKSAFYISLPADATNESMIVLLYLTFDYLRKMNKLDMDVAIDNLKESLQYGFLDDYDHPVFRQNEEMLISGKRTRKYTAAGEKLAQYKLEEITDELNYSLSVKDFVIATSLRNKKGKIYYAYDIDEYDDRENADLVNNISYLFNSIFGASSTPIWHNFVDICQNIQCKNFEDIKKQLDLAK